MTFKNPMFFKEIVIEQVDEIDELQQLFSSLPASTDNELKPVDDAVKVFS